MHQDAVPRRDCLNGLPALPRTICRPKIGRCFLLFAPKITLSNNYGLSTDFEDPRRFILKRSCRFVGEQTLDFRRKPTSWCRDASNNMFSNESVYLNFGRRYVCSTDLSLQQVFVIFVVFYIDCAILFTTTPLNKNNFYSFADVFERFGDVLGVFLEDV